MSETTRPHFSGKTAFITGAGGGIGAAIATALSGSEAAVAMVSRSGRGPTLPNSLTAAVDVRDRDAMKGTAERTVEHDGIDIVIGNAGVGSWAPFIKTPDNDVQEMPDVNVRGLFNTVSETLPYLQEKAQGTLLRLPSKQAVADCPTEPPTLPRSSPTWDSHAHLTTTSGRAVSGAPISAQEESRVTLGWDGGGAFPACLN